MSQHGTSKEPDDGPHPVNNRQPEANQLEPETTQPALRAFLLGGFTLEQADGVPIDVVTSIGRSQSQLLLKLLLCHPHRQMARELLTEIIWPGQPFSTMKGSLSVAKSLLKTGLEALCGYVVLPHATGDPPSYRLIGQNVLWTDVDACDYAIRQAIATPQAREAMVLWETAYALLQRGILLATDQEAYWYHAHLVQDRGKKLAKQRSQCVGRIADLALMCGDANRAIDVLTTEHEANPIHEDTAFYLMDLLAQLGRNAEALQAYARLEAALLEHDAEPRPEIQALAQRLRSTATTRASVRRPMLVPQEEIDRSIAESVSNLPPVYLLLKHELPSSIERTIIDQGEALSVDHHVYHVTMPSSPMLSQGYSTELPSDGQTEKIGVSSSLPLNSRHMLESGIALMKEERRHLLQNMLNLATSVVAAPQVFLEMASLERLAKEVTSPSKVDDFTLTQLV